MGAAWGETQAAGGGFCRTHGVSHPHPWAWLQSGGLLQPDPGGSAPLQRVLQSARVQALPDAVRGGARVQHLQVRGAAWWDPGSQKGSRGPGPRMGTQNPGSAFQDHVPRGLAGGEARGPAGARSVLPGLEEAASGSAHL